MVNSLFLATVFRIGFVIISYGCKVPAGIFVPSMAVGAAFGRMVGIIVKAMYRCVATFVDRFPGYISFRRVELILPPAGLPSVNRMRLVSRLEHTHFSELQRH